MHQPNGLSATIGLQNIEKMTSLNFGVTGCMFISGCKQHIVCAKA